MEVTRVPFAQRCLSQQEEKSIADMQAVDPSYRHKVLKHTGNSFDYGDYYHDDHAKLLVLYSGGTIGMRSHHGVYSPEPNYLVPELRKLSIFHDPEFVSSPRAEHPSQRPLIMPLSKFGKRIFYRVCEYEPLLDSANMTFGDYARLANDIKDNYDQFDGFVILHGTDTMAYTASALSFMFEHLGKPVILTGSQIPIFETRSDGRDNFLGALTMAGHYCIPEVMIYFHNNLLRGNRSTKVDTGSLDAFKSPNLSPLAELEIDIKVNWDAVFRPLGIHKFAVHTKMCANVGILRLFPSITKQCVEAFLQPPMQGVVVQSYGAGNGPSERKDLLEVFKLASERGIIILNITQCSRGAVSTAYETGKALLDAGVLPGSDLTSEAALMKLSYVLSFEDETVDEKRQLLSQNLRGEMKVAMPLSRSLKQFTLIESLAQMMKISSSEEMQLLRESVLPSLSCSAACKGDLDSLEKIWQAGGNPTIADYDGRTPLHIASCENHIKVVEFLMDTMGASVHQRDRYGHSALDDAVRYAHLEVIDILCRGGAHLAIPPPKLGMMLCNTAAHETVDGLEAWRRAGADLNQGDYTGKTALHMAIAKKNMDAVVYLLEQGVRVDICDAFGHKPRDETTDPDILKLLDLHEKKQGESDIINGAVH